MSAFSTVLSILAVSMAVTRDDQRSITGLVLIPVVVSMGSRLDLTAHFRSRRDRRLRLLLGLSGITAMT